MTCCIVQYTAGGASEQVTECPGDAEGASFVDNFDNLNLDELNIEYIRDCVINAAFEEVQQYDVYR